MPGKAPQELAVGTGTPRARVREDGAAVAAYPDRTGDAAVSILPVRVRAAPVRAGRTTCRTAGTLTKDAPERRHRPLAVAAPDGGPLVLDLVQTRTRTSLLVVGPKAPKGTLLSVGGLRVLRGTLAADDDTVAVAYAAGGRVKLATARARRDMAHAHAARLRRAAPRARPRWRSTAGSRSSCGRAARAASRGRELFAWSGGRTRRVTRSRGDDGQPLVAPREGAASSSPGRATTDRRRDAAAPPGRRWPAPAAPGGTLDSPSTTRIRRHDRSPADFFDRPLHEVDPEVADAIDKELGRQQRTLEMIASENFVPQSILECQGSVLTNKYAEGYPGRRYYGGCEHIDVIEQLAIDRAKALFGAEHANVQPHAGAQANTVRLPRAAAAGRQADGPLARPRRPPLATA